MTTDPDEVLIPHGCAEVYRDGDTFGFPVSIGSTEVGTVWRLGPAWFLATLASGTRLGHHESFPDALAELGATVFHDEHEVAVH